MSESQNYVDTCIAAALRRAAEIEFDEPTGCSTSIRSGLSGAAKEAILALISEPATRHLEAVIAAARRSALEEAAHVAYENGHEEVSKLILMLQSGASSLELREAQAVLVEAEWWMNNWYGEHSKYKECECLACNRLAAARERVTKLEGK